jgi:tyrosyl-DNA phosphodiesterase-1
MVPTFKTDTPKHHKKERDLVIGARMPYDLPLVPYGANDLPWVPTETYAERDWKGYAWDGWDK